MVDYKSLVDTFEEDVIIDTLIAKDNQIAELQEKLKFAMNFQQETADKLHRRNLQIANLKSKLSAYENIPDKKTNPQEYEYWISSEYHNR